MKTHKTTINTISVLITKNSITPTEFRYICAEVRKQCKLIIPKRENKLPDYLNASEIYTFLQEAGKNNTDGVLAEFLIFTGVRISEATHLQIQDIDFNNNQIKIVQGKGHKDRYVPITSNLLHKLKLYIRDRKRGYVFSQKNEKPFCIRALQKRIKNALLKCNFSKDLHTHSLRHTFACLCLSRGIGINEIKLFMGHTSIKTTEIYAKLELGSVKQEFLSLMDLRG